MSVPTYGFPDELVLIDSPGLDAFNLEVHEKLTIENLLPMMDFCIFVTTMKTNSDNKMRSILDTISEYNVPLIIVQNMLDSVQPSIDGKKTKQMVVQEHKRRVERIVEHSKIADKSTVRIVQISAVNALKQRISRNPDLAALNESNYHKLIEQVREVLDIIRPRIEANRLVSVKRELQRLVAEGREDGKKLAANDSGKFQFEGVDKNIQKQFESISNKILAQLNKLQLSHKSSQELNIWLDDPDIDDCTLDIIRNYINSCENEMLECFRNFNNLIRSTAKKLNIDVRNIMSISSFGAIGASLSVQTTTKTRRVKKDGFINGLKRFAGFFIDADWGYEYVTESVVDTSSTRQKAREYVGKAQRSCKKTAEEWFGASEKKIDEILDEIELRRNAYNERMSTTLSAVELVGVIDKLEKLEKSITVLKPDKKSGIKQTETDFSAVQTKMTITAEQFERFCTLRDKANSIINLIHRSTHSTLLNKLNAEGDFAVVGWDALCMSSYISRAFGATIDDETIEKNSGKPVKCQGFSYCLSPVGINFRGYKNLAVITNATQISQALKQINDSSILTGKWEKVFFVLQDFSEAVNGNMVDGVIEGMLDVPSELKIQCPSLILINHPNPVYNLCCVQAQLSPTSTDADIVEIVAMIRKRFPAFTSPAIEKTGSEIIKTIFDRRKKNVIQECKKSKK